MSKEDVIKTTLELSGEREYKKSVTQISQNLKVLSSQMRLTTHSFADNSSSMEALKAKSAILNKQVEQQESKVSTLTSALNRAKDVYGENSKQAQNWEVKLNSAKIALDKTKGSLDAFNSQNKGMLELNGAAEKFKNSVSDIASKSKTVQGIGSAFDSVKGNIAKATEKLEPMNKLIGKAKTGADMAGAGFKLLGDKVKGVGEKLEPVAKGIKTVGNASLKAVTTSVDVATKAITAYSAALAGAGAAAFAIANSTADAGQEINKMSQMVGMSTQTYQEWDYIAKSTGTSMDTLQGGITDIAEKMDDAAAGSGEAAEIFSQLGISVTDSTGQLRSQEEVFEETITALQGMENSTKKQALATKLMSTTGEELLPLLNQEAGSVEELKEKANSLNGVMGEESIKAGLKFKNSVVDMKTVFGGIKNSIGAVLLPSFTQATDSITEFAANLATAFKQGGMDGFIEQLETDSPMLIESLSGVINSLIPTLTTGITMAIEAITTILPPLITNLLPTLISSATQLINGLVGAFPTLIPVIANGALTLFTGLIDGINEVLPQLIAVMPVMVNDISNALIENLPTIIDGGIQILVSLIEGITTTIPVLVEKVIELIPVITDALMDNLPLIIEAGMQLLLAVTQGILAAIPQLIQSLPEVISSIVSGLLSSIPSIFSVGTDIVKGLLEGITSMGGWLMDSVKGFFGGIVDGVKDFLGIHSPSRVFAEVGTYMAEGVGVGFGAEMDTVSSDMQESIPTSFEMNADIEGQGVIMPDLTMPANQCATSTINTLVEGLKLGAARMVEATNELNLAIINGFILFEPQVTGQGISMDKALGFGIVKGIPMVTLRVNQLINSVVNTFSASNGRFVDIGKNIMRGIGEGITSMSGWLNSLIDNYIDSMVEDVEDKLEIHSPSRVFAGIGQFMAKGLGVGFVNEMRNVSSEIQNAIPTKAPQMAYANSGYGRFERTDRVAPVVVNQNIYAPVGDYIAQQKEARKQFEQMARDL